MLSTLQFIFKLLESDSGFRFETIATVLTVLSVGTLILAITKVFKK